MPSKSKGRGQATVPHPSVHARLPANVDVDWVYCDCEEGRKRKPRRAILLTTKSNKNGNQGRKFFKCRRKTGCNFFLWLDEYERSRPGQLVDEAETDEPLADHEQSQPGSSSHGASSSIDGLPLESTAAPATPSKKRARSDDEGDDKVKLPPSVKKVRFDEHPPKLEVDVEDDKCKVAVQDSKMFEDEGEGAGEETVEDSEVEESGLSLTLDEPYVKPEVEADE